MFLKKLLISYFGDFPFCVLFLNKCFELKLSKGSSNPLYNKIPLALRLKLLYTLSYTYPWFVLALNAVSSSEIRHHPETEQRCSWNVTKKTMPNMNVIITYKL